MADVMCSCCWTEDAKNQRFASRAIDRQLRKDKDRFRRTVKILLLGSGESGKSTFLKQMRIINGNDFVEEELRQYRLVIYSNVVKGMKVLIDARDKLCIAWGDEANADQAQLVLGYDSSVRLEESVFAQFVPAISALWADSGIRMAFDRRREFQLVDKFFVIHVNSVFSVIKNNNSSGRSAILLLALENC